ncbi:Stk1 family PASTA domain-containing Ser/Thr kinase, partial [Streptomyces montanisoli]
QDAVALLAAVREARAALTDAQLDAVPPGARPAGAASGSENRTSVIPRSAPPGADAAGVSRTSRLDLPPVPPAAGGGRTAGRPPGRHRTLVAVVAALVAILIGTGVWYINSGQFTRVPSLLGQTEQVAKKRLSDAGLDARVTHGYSDAFDRGKVMRTYPAPETKIRGDGPVTLTISRGPRIVSVPDVSGMPQADAKAALAKAGLSAGVVHQAFSDSVDRGSVIGTDPAAGARLRPDRAVALKVSRGSAVDVPDVTGEDVHEATADLADAGLRAKIATRRVESDQDAGAVARQSPAEGGQLAEGDTVTLTLSKGPKMVAVPDVTGRSADDATKALEDAGFDVKVKHSFPFIDDTITDQSVAGGDKAPEGSTITITTNGL